MHLPFTVDQFLDTFRRYNEAVWPAQWLLFLLGVAAVVLAFRSRPHAARAIYGILAVLWLWMGAVYHLGFFRTINPAAAVFGELFIAQGVLFAWLAVRHGNTHIHVRADAVGLTGVSLGLYALLFYPLLGSALGHRYPEFATFGLPCPTAILTLALLLWIEPPITPVVFVVPMLWTVVGTSAALDLGMREDIGLVAAGAATAVILMRRFRRRRMSLPRSA